MLLASVALAVSTAAVSVSTRSYALPDLVVQVQHEGEGAVLTDPLASQIGVDDPTTTRVLHYPEAEDDLSRSVYVSVHQKGLRTGEEPKPQFVILVTERRAPGLVERRYLRLAPDGKLQQATQVRDKVDADGALKPGGRSVESFSVKKAQDWLDHENDFYFHGKYRKQKEAP